MGLEGTKNAYKQVVQTLMLFNTDTLAAFFQLILKALWSTFSDQLMEEEKSEFLTDESLWYLDASLTIYNDCPQGLIRGDPARYRRG